MRIFRSFGASLLAVLLLSQLGRPEIVHAQEGQEASPSAALSSLLLAACRQNEAGFALRMTADNAAAFRNLSPDERKALLRRISLADDPGRALISSDAQNHMIVRCETPGATVEFRFGDERLRENLAYVTVEARVHEVDSRTIDFGLVREGGGWRLLSLGLLLFNIPQLSKQWAEQDLTAREAAVIKTIRGLADAVATYRKIYDRLPGSLAQLGPTAKDGVSPDAADLIAEDLAGGSRGGYRYKYAIRRAANGVDPGFEIMAGPIEYGKNGRRSFYLDVEDKIHGADHQGGAATAEDALVSPP